MTLQRLGIRNVRNIKHASLELEPGINLLVGPNGSGKTSLLEAIYFLGSGRTFRSNSLDPLISRDQAQCTVNAVIVDGEIRLTLGIERSRDGSREIRINMESAARVSELARRLPALVLGPNTVELVTGPPSMRRSFLNWGVFHVEHTFGGLWEQLNRCLRQRNESLRQGVAFEQLRPWDEQFCALSEQVDALRQAYVDGFVEAYYAMVERLAGVPEVACTYYRGWDRDESLASVLARQRESDLARGHTQAGPHRADLRLRVEGETAARVCSRGELKILAWALVLRQGEQYADALGKSPVYLVDDLASELDSEHRGNVCRFLAESGSQAIITAIEREALADAWADPRVFHVEHGGFSVEEKADEQR